MAQDLASNLQTRKYPVAVYYGPERVSYVGADDLRITLSRAGGDVIAPPKGEQANGRKRYTRHLGVLARIQARSPVAGARVNEHEHECDALVDALITALYEWASAWQSIVVIGNGAYVLPEEFNGAEIGSSVVYDLPFHVARGVITKDYEGAVRPMSPPLHGVSTGSVLVSRDGGTAEQVGN
jgi:hypothetical protein